MIKLSYNQAMALDKFLARYPTGMGFERVLDMVVEHECVRHFDIMIWGDYHHINRETLVEMIRDLENFTSELDFDNGVYE